MGFIIITIYILFIATMVCVIHDPFRWTIQAYFGNGIAVAKLKRHRAINTLTALYMEQHGWDEWQARRQADVQYQQDCQAQNTRKPT